MSEQPGTTIDELVAALKRRRAPLPFEIGTFVALSACEQLSSAPAVVRGRDVRIAQDGAVSLAPPTSRASDEAGARSIAALLAQLLVAAGPSVPPRLLTLVERGPADGSWRIERLRDDLAAVLVPLNRGASQRVLARLVRESTREQRPSSATAEAEAATRGGLDQDLDALFDGPSRGAQASSLPATEEAFDTLPGGPVPAGAESEDSTAAGDLGAVEIAAESDDATASGDVRAVELASRTSMASTSATAQVARSAPRVVADRVSLDGLDDGSKQGRGGVMIVAALVVLLTAVAAGVYLLQPERFDGWRGSRQSAVTQQRFGELLVHATPDGTQVLLYIGRGPAVAKDVALGVAHEFVVLADGKAPSRTVVGADAPWESTAEGKRYEVAMLAGDRDVAFDALELGAVLASPRAPVAGAARGEIRIVTAPRGAKVYRLIGTTPDVRVAHLPTDEAVELLLFAEGHVPERRIVGPSDWRDEHGEHVAEVIVTLVARPAPAQ